MSERERSTEPRVPVAQPSPVAEVIAVLGAQLAVVGAFLSGGSTPGLVAAAGAALGAGIAWLVARSASRPRPRPIRREGDDVVIDGRARIPVSRIHAIDLRAVRVDGERAPTAGGEVLRMRWIDAHDRVLAELEVGSREEAERLLAELGLDDARPAQEIALVPRAFSFSQGNHRVLSALGAATLAVVARWDLGLFSYLSALFVLLLGSIAIAGRVRIGEDGLEIRSAIGRRRFVAFSEIERVEREHGVVHLRLKSGESVELAVAGARQGRWQSAHADALVNAIRRGLERRGPAARAPLVAQLARGQRDEPAWRNDLRALAREGGYRGMALRDDELLAVVRDPGADPSAREGAAIVLRARGADPAALRELAARSAHPRVRVALEELAGEDENEDASAAASRRRAR